jgi:dCMP deaminase
VSSKMSRIGKEQYFLEMAKICALRGTCLRRNYGVVVVNTMDNTVVSTGYTGSPSGSEHCLDIGRCWREDNNIPSGSNYEKCRSVHAEQNALLQAGKNAKGCNLFLVGLDKDKQEFFPEPCYLCLKMMVNSGIDVVFRRRQGEILYEPVGRLFEEVTDRIFSDCS